MSKLAELGNTLATLRKIRGFGQEECAAAAGLEAADLMSIEEGNTTPQAIEKLAAFYGINPNGLRKGLIEPRDSTTAATVFLLHGPYQDFDSRDLDALSQATLAARYFSAATEQGNQAHFRRLDIVPERPAGPLPRNAAQQGYRLARTLRAALGLGGEPLGDLRQFIEEQLGIVVLVSPLESSELRAASVLDKGRASAAIILAADDPWRKANPSLARVYLAHELSHLLFDPSAPGRVQIALDDLPLRGEKPPEAPSAIALMESRAKGFAAEFLIPRQGVLTLLGECPEAPCADPPRATTMVSHVSDHFQTPWEITTRHLCNLQWLDEDVIGEVLAARKQPQSITTLPAQGALPLCLKSLTALPEWDTKIPQDSWRVAASTDEQNAREILEKSYALASTEQPIAATDLLVQHVDALLSGNELTRVQIVLQKLEPKRLPLHALTGVLSVTRSAKDMLGGLLKDEHEQAFDKIVAAHLLSEERKTRLRARIR